MSKHERFTMGMGGLDVAAPDFVTFDPSLPASDRLGDNAGCPPGYFAQYVDPALQPQGPFSPHGSAIRCRLMATSTAATIQDESGPPWWVESALSYDQALRRVVPGGLLAMPWWLPLAGVGLLALMLLRR